LDKHEHFLFDTEFFGDHKHGVLWSEVWFVHHFSKHTFFVLALLGVFFGMQEKRHLGWAGGIFASVVGKANDFLLLDRIVENERESKKPKMSGGVIPRLYCSQCQRLLPRANLLLMRKVA
jgi:hypothetical protein